MKVTMSADGVITLAPENSVEAFALGQWADRALIPARDIQRGEAVYWRGSHLTVMTGVPVQSQQGDA